MAIYLQQGFSCTSCGEYTRVQLDMHQTEKWVLVGRTSAREYFRNLTPEEARFLDERVCTNCNSTKEQVSGNQTIG